MELNEQDWELINDDGFVYRRLKRPRPDSAVPTTVPPPDPAAEAKARTDRKKNLLLKLKTKYQQEIAHWDILSNTLQALQKRTLNQQLVAVTQVLDQRVSGFHGNSLDSSCQELIVNLLSQVEAQEATISEISRLCDVVEALCDAEERRLSQHFIDLPIWEPNPQELVASLLED